MLLPSWSLASAPMVWEDPTALLRATRIFKVVFMDPHYVPQQ